ncbi:MAG: beta-Ala-His dipeptidase [FCB group bacterium]|nr:beta-Ala-His dipeptidase [FCB group bacterium]
MNKIADRAAIEALQPSSVWKFFAGLAATPRPSKREDKIRAHIHATVKSLGFAAREDHVHNIIVEAPATKGYEKAPLTVLQAHLDMVPEKNAGTRHEFDTDPIRLIIDKDAKGETIVRADGTTLGADNGIGVALALAAATSPEVVHGPLELLFTSDEEDGMTGAKGLKPGTFKGKRLINLDSEEDNALYMGCAGGCDTVLTWRFPAEPVGGDLECCRISITGLRGGHSGGNIHEGRGSANRLLVRTLLRAKRDDLRIVQMSGGSKRNAIAREAWAVVRGATGFRAAVEAAARLVEAQAKAESFEANAQVRVEDAVEEFPAAVSAHDTKKLLTALAALPHGVLGMHPKVPELVETSNNLATLTTDQGADGKSFSITMAMLSRSSSESRMDEALDQITAIGRMSDAKIQHANRYPGWEPNVDSPILATCQRIYRELFEESPRVAAIHAGLECGIIGRQVGGGVDMVSFGPRIEGAHSPDERVWVDSVGKSWKYLKAVLADLAKG